MDCVLDASVVVRWWLSSTSPELDRASRTFLNAYCEGSLQVQVPDLVFAEAANAFWKSARAGQWTRTASERALEELCALGLTGHRLAPLASEAMNVALAKDVSVYDAVYVALAKRLGVPLFTADRKLSQKLAALPEVRFVSET